MIKLLILDAGRQEQNYLSFLNENFHFVSPKEIMWVDASHNWDSAQKCLAGEFSEGHLWGLHENHSHYGGF